MNAYTKWQYASILLAGIFLCSDTLRASEQTGIAISESLHSREQVERLVYAGSVKEYRKIVSGLMHCRIGYSYYCEYKLTGMGDMLANAITHFKKAVEVTPQLPTANYLYASYLIDKGKHAEAIRHLRQIQNSSDLWPAAHRLMCYAYGNMAGAHVSVTVEGKTTVDSDPKTFLIENKRKVTDQDRIGWLDKAEKCLKQAHAVDPDNPDNIYFRAGLSLSNVWWKEENRSLPIPEDTIKLYKRYLYNASVTARTWPRFNFAMRMAKIGVDELPPPMQKQYNKLKKQRILTIQRSRASTANISYPALSAVHYISELDGTVGKLIDLEIYPDGALRAVYSEADKQTAKSMLYSEDARGALAELKIKSDKTNANGIVVTARLRKKPTSKEFPEWSDDMADNVKNSLTKRAQNMLWPAPIFRRIKTPQWYLLECDMHHNSASAMYIRDAMRQAKKIFRSIPTVCHRIHIERSDDKFSVKFTLRGYLSRVSDSEPIRRIQ